MTQSTPRVASDLVLLGLTAEEAAALTAAIEQGAAEGDPEKAWRRIYTAILRPEHPFEAHLRAHEAVFANWDASKRPAPVWVPDPESITQTNLAKLMRDRGLEDYDALSKWSINDRFSFWDEIIKRLGIRFRQTPEGIVANEAEVESPTWLPGAKLNIADSCFSADRQSTAIVYAKQDGALPRMTLGELEAMTNQVANGLRDLGLDPGDAVAIDMLMTTESVAIYLGIVKAGCVVVSIADSFAAEEIATRLRIANAKAIFTQDVILRSGKRLPLYEKVKQADAPQAIVLPAEDELSIELAEGDLAWTDFLSENDIFESVARDPQDHSNILFSSGTTGAPKAIPWTHTTPIKCAADGWLHHDIRPGDVVAWPTNLGWMMGPWLIYASLVSGATIALYEGAPNTRGFCEFVANAKVTMLGVVPSLVKAWRMSGCVDGLDWSSIRAFSSTGECSNAQDMFWLMSRAQYKPVIEYCGGTEIGGGYITGTMVQPTTPATFTTPALGLEVVIVDEQGNEAETGELFLIGPSIGLSNELLNRDHHKVYYEGTPHGPRGELLRRHGDEMRRLGGGYFQALGRADDTMNLGGIKTSAAELERVLNATPGVQETAAIAVPPPGGGPDRLIVFAVPEAGASFEPVEVQPVMQEAIRRHLNPLFRIHEVRCIGSLPRTASNKVIRRTLRAEYQGSS
ncbi:MAG: AMP-binding protein [Phycisphaerales bacterium]